MKAELKKEGKEWLKATVIAIVLLIFIRAFFITSYVVEGGSMFPTLEDGNKLIVNKFIYRISDLERFDVIVFHANKHADYVKRVIGLPGDTVEYKNEQLYINGELYKEPYLGTYGLDENATGDFKVYVPEGKLFVLGDNRKNSLDSRDFGFIDIDSVVGKVNLRYWPLNELTVFF